MIPTRRIRIRFLLLSLIMLLSLGLSAQNQLFYLEAQGVTGYNFTREKTIFYSFHAKDAMQKPSIGFDWLKRFTDGDKDLFVASVQFRLAANNAEVTPVEPQLYNAWLKYKSPYGDISAGHLKPASGLSYSLDNHALLLPDMTMFTFTYDRDWGMQYSKDTSWGNVSASLTNASGMLLEREDNQNYLAALHVSYGVLNEDNYSLGMTLQKGEILEGMGYHIGHNRIVHDEALAGLDATVRFNNLESMLDIYAGEFYQHDAWSVLWRNGINILPEEKLKLEAQGVWREFVGKKHTNYDAGLTWKFHPDWAFRVLYDYHIVNDYVTETDASGVVGQIYYYKRLF